MSDHSRKMERQRDELLEALESFLGRARIGEVNKGMFVRIEELEGLSAAIAAVKATGKEIA
jgi:DNA-binding transcriptional MocR family regulator